MNTHRLKLRLFQRVPYLKMTELESVLMLPSQSFGGNDLLLYEWNKKYEEKTLTALDFKQHWAKMVPIIYCHSPDEEIPNTEEIQRKATLEEKELFEPLEKFICGDENTARVFEQLRQLNDTPTLCGKVFKAGEPTYSCRECGLDPTCVLCNVCFKNSEHRNHRYKMSTSGGGGLCDCGDEEAWKCYSYCDIHHGKSQGFDGSTPLDKLPADIVERLEFVLGVVFQYCHTMLTWEHAINLPVDLQSSPQTQEAEVPDTYCTVLFNDETHTYEQVIETLVKAINCTKKEAIDYATTIDREGRSIVRSSTFTTCNSVRHFIERVTSRSGSKLKVLVIHTEVIAHQTFAIKLLTWLQKIISLNTGFAHVFTNAIMVENLLENIMLVDTQLWKNARNQWHQLFITGMLMDLSCKKTFAKSFIQVYPTILQEFITDDHDHSISVSSLSVQIFTVPTLAHYLIQEENAIAVVLRAFLVECERRHINGQGKLHFQRNLNNSNFRRAQYMLHDLGYLVTVPPPQWNDPLRKNFCHGMHSFFKLLEMMQDMDPVVRQVGQHVEFEAEWETGINLQLKLASIVTALLRWCTSDYTVFIKCVRSNLKHFSTSQPKPTFIGVELANHSTSCIEYDVSSEAVSIHLPLVRFLAGLLLHMDKFSLSYEDPQFIMENIERVSPEQLMELPMRTLVMLAQFRAGMWRRNGYSLLNQVYFYHNVRLREEMYDRDVLMLQIVASMIESNEFLIHVIYKYGLLNWASEMYDGTSRKPEEDNIRQVLTVAEEFLSLILTIVSERFIPNLGSVTESEKVKKEIIQLLCIEPMPHSQLFKLLPRDPLHDVSFESVINEVATFKMPQGSGVGKYELKPEYFKCFNPFYYHYSREEQSKAEEVQVKRKKQHCEEVCCPPPVAPEFSPRFGIIINILQCDVMLHIMEQVLKRTQNLHSSAFSETQLEKVLHLIGVALHEEERVTKQEAENSFFCFTSKANKRNFMHLLEDCSKCPRIEICSESLKDLLSWTITKYKCVESLHVRDSDKSKELEMAEASSSASKSNARDRKRKTEMAAARRTRIMAQMSAMQKSFIKEHADMFKETLVEDSNLSKSEMDIYTELSEEDPVCFYKDFRWRSTASNIYTCILCREDQELTCAGRSLVLSSFVQKSSILSKNGKHEMTDPQNYDPLLLPADLFWSVHSSTCGHVMHSDCWQKFFDSVVQKEQRRPARFGRHTSFDVEKKEFLCPLCERLSNTVIPLIPPLTSLIPPTISTENIDISMDEWLSAVKKASESFQLDKEDSPSEESSMHSSFNYKATTVDNALKGNSEPNHEKFKALFSLFEVDSVTDTGPSFSQNLVDMMKLFSEATYTVGLNANINLSDVRIPSLSWASCAYTIHAMEWLLRDKNKALFGAHSSRNALCLDGIIRFCGASLRIFDHSIIRSNCIRILRYLVLGDHYLSSPQCCLDLDAFSVLVFLSLSMPVLFERGGADKKVIPHPLGTTLDKYILHLLLIFHFVQVLLTYPFHEEEKMETDSHTSEGDPERISRLHGENVTALLFYEEVRTAAGFDQWNPAPSGHTIVHCLKSGSLPFLRCAAIFFHVLTDTIPPASLQEVNEKEFENICAYLSLPPTLDELLASTSLKHLALSWARHPRTLHLLMNPEQSKTLSLVRHPLSINKLISLPYDYSDLINSVSHFTCPSSDGDDSRNPTMCLVCGKVLCSQSYCCQVELNGTLVGSCTDHAFYCGSGIGIFLRIRDCKILLLSDKNKGCFAPPPYIDEYGETDQGLLRGNPLHLCQERYEELNELWLSHNIPERVSHSMEQSTTLPNWQLL